MAAPKPGETGDLFSQVRPRAMGVGELTRLLRAQVEPRFRDVWVAGEIANFRRQSSGHLYFTLKDDEAAIGAVLWASQARRVPFALGPDRVVGVHVGGGRSRAPFRLASQDQVDPLLAILVELRGGRAARRAAR